MPGPERQAPRIQPFVVPCRYVVGEARFTGFLTDISTSGCRIHTDSEPPATGVALTIEARLGRHPTHVRIPGRVRWTRPGPRGGHIFGLSFEAIGADEQRVLEGVIEEFRRRAAAIQ